MAESNKVNRYRVRFLSPDLKFAIRKHFLARLTKAAGLLSYLVFPLLPKRWVDLDRPIFIIGCSRSGTTIFLDLLKEHPEILNWSEAAQIINLDYFFPQTEDMRNEDNATEMERRRLKTFFGLRRALSGKPRFLNKHPQNSFRIRYLNRIFPNACFVHLIRDGRATVLSNIKQVQRDSYRQKLPFGGFPKPPGWQGLLGGSWLVKFAHLWDATIRVIREDVERLGIQDRYLEVRYEDFCGDPGNVLEQVDRFLGVDPKENHFIYWV